MHEMLSRKERQLEKFENAAKRGQTSVTLIAFPSEARYWIRQGGIHCDMDKVETINEKNHLGYYTFSFNHSHKLHSMFFVNDIIHEDAPLSHYNFGEKLFIRAQRVANHEE